MTTQHQTQLSIPYKWSTGDAYGRFLSGLQNRQLWASACRDCDSVLIPPTDTCRHCGGNGLEWRQVEPQGVLIAAHHVGDTYPGGPEAPYRLGIIEFDGGARMVHRVASDSTVGSVVHAVWADETSGTILDIVEFGEPQQ